MTNTPALSDFRRHASRDDSETRKRMAFVLGGVEIGGGNIDFSLELYYLLSPQDDHVVRGFVVLHGASNMPVATATPVPESKPKSDANAEPRSGVAPRPGGR